MVCARAGLASQPGISRAVLNAQAVRNNDSHSTGPGHTHSVPMLHIGSKSDRFWEVSDLHVCYTG